ncbi:MAG: tRNA (guanosine(37)-N1)-methyltransferase TrmD [Bacteroidia bacterium]|nr:tRNA (guanosine(37)-N1)-methyltransferase TrmD [Bacteroidia bacterium]
MRIDILSVVPDQLTSPLNTSIIKRACDKGLVEIVVHDIREFGQGKYKQVDDTVFGGGAGMVLMIEPIALCIRNLQSQRKYDEIIYMTPDGETLKQSHCNQMSLLENIIILCGHYKGIDQRIRDIFITREISIGDFVLSGGELPALMLTDALVRLLPGSIGDETSALSDSFQDNLLEAPIYTRPREFEGHKVPDILLSGNFPEIDKWRDQMAYEKTRLRRPDLLDFDGE